MGALLSTGTNTAARERAVTRVPCRPKQCTGDYIPHVSMDKQVESGFSIDIYKAIDPKEMSGMDKYEHCEFNITDDMGAVGAGREIESMIEFLGGRSISSAFVYIHHAGEYQFNEDRADAIEEFVTGQEATPARIELLSVYVCFPMENEKKKAFKAFLSALLQIRLRMQPKGSQNADSGRRFEIEFCQ
jgi:hypothetical protein